MIIHIAGPKKFLIIAILFSVFGGYLQYALTVNSESVPFLVWSAPVLIIFFALIFFYIWIDTLRTTTRVGANDLPSKYGFLVVGYLFSVVGFGMTAAQIGYHFLPAVIAVQLAYWISDGIFFIPGLIMLIVFFKNRFGSLTSAQIEKAGDRIGAIIGAAVGVFTLVGMLVSGIVVLVTAQDEKMLLVGVLFTAASLVFIFLFGIIFYFVKKQPAKKSP